MSTEPGTRPKSPSDVRELCGLPADDDECLMALERIVDGGEVIERMHSALTGSLDQLLAALKNGQSADAKNFAIVAGITYDKVRLLRETERW